MPKLTYSRNLVGSGLSFPSSEVKTYNGGVAIGPINVPKGKAGTLSTRTDGTSGILTVSAGHGFYVGLVFDLYWSGGIQVGCEVSAKTSTTITFIASTLRNTGDNLPVVTTAIVASQQVEIGHNILNLAGFLSYQFLNVTSKCNISTFSTTGGEGAKNSNLVNGGEVIIHDIDEGVASGLADSNLLEMFEGLNSEETSDDINSVFLSNGSSSAAAAFYLNSLYDVTPGSSS